MDRRSAVPAPKYPNFYVDTSAYALHRLPRDLVSYLQGPDRTRVIFGTNWPMLSPARALERIGDLGLDEDAKRLFLGGNARRVVGLPETQAAAERTTA